MVNADQPIVCSKPVERMSGSLPKPQKHMENNMLRKESSLKKKKRKHNTKPLFQLFRVSYMNHFKLFNYIQPKIVCSTTSNHIGFNCHWSS